MPVGAPLALSFRISPPNGLAVSAVIPAMRSAALFATAAWPSARVRNTGFSGAIASRSAAVGNCGGFQKVSIHPRPVIHLPASRLRDALFHLREKLLARIRALPGSACISRSPMPKMWQCASVKPGKHGAAAQIDDPRAFSRELPRRRGCADESDALAFDGDGFGARLLLVAGVDIAVQENRDRAVRPRHESRRQHS